MSIRKPTTPNHKHHTGEMVRTWARDHDISGDEMAKRLSISRSSLYQLYRRSAWPIERLKSASKITNIDIATLAGQTRYGGPNEFLNDMLRELDAALADVNRMVEHMREREPSLDSQTPVEQSKSTNSTRRSAPRRGLGVTKAPQLELGSDET